MDFEDSLEYVSDSAMNANHAQSSDPNIRTSLDPGSGNFKLISSHEKVLPADQLQPTITKVPVEDFQSTIRHHQVPHHLHMPDRTPNFSGHSISVPTAYTNQHDPTPTGCSLPNSKHGSTTFNILSYSRIRNASTDLNGVASPASNLSRTVESSPDIFPPSFFSEINYFNNSNSRSNTSSSNFNIMGNCEPSGLEDVPASMDVIENSLFNKLMSQILDSESVLLIHSLFALSVYYIRSNSLKGFQINGLGFEDKDNLVQYKKQRALFKKLSSKYYDLAIHELRLLISSKDFDVTTAIIVSSILNRISIYEYSNLNYSVTFSKGMVSIFNDVLVNIQTSESNILNKIKYLRDMGWITNYILHASRTNHFPPYNPNLLHECMEIIDSFKEIMLQIQHRQDSNLIVNNQYTLPVTNSIIFHFNHLRRYVLEIISLCSKHDIADINDDPFILYKVLRHWLIILPSKMHIFPHLKSNILEITLMHLYQAMSRILENIFPSVQFHFFQGFCGGVTLRSDSRKDSIFSTALDLKLELLFESHGRLGRQSDLYNPLQCNSLIKINKYCKRLTFFFKKRSNLSAILFGDQKYQPEIPPRLVQQNFCEVSIERFNYTNFKLYHYLHLPHVLRIHKNENIIKNIKYYNSTKQLYAYNKHNFEHFMSNHSTQVPRKVVQNSKMDPMFRLHLFNIASIAIDVNSSDEDSTNSTPKFGYQPGKQSNIPGVNPTLFKTHDGKDTFSYEYVFLDEFSKVVVQKISKDYEELFEKGPNQEEQEIVFEHHPRSGLFINDTDPLLLAISSNAGNVFHRKIRNLFTNQEISKIFLNYYNQRNIIVKERLERIPVQCEGKCTEESKFYDDLNESYFALV